MNYLLHDADGNRNGASLKTQFETVRQDISELLDLVLQSKPESRVSSAVLVEKLKLLKERYIISVYHNGRNSNGGSGIGKDAVCDTRTNGAPYQINSQWKEWAVPTQENEGFHVLGRISSNVHSKMAPLQLPAKCLLPLSAYALTVSDDCAIQLQHRTHDNALWNQPFHRNTYHSYLPPGMV